jgi:uncharacterized cofD-like protein
MKIITFGGGTGHHQLALALKNLYGENNNHYVRVSFIVGNWDNGGSSKFLRIGENILPPGDIRNVFSALSNLDSLKKEIEWDGRVNTGQESKHSIGNIKLALLINKYKGNWNNINEYLKKELKIGENFNVYPLSNEENDLYAVFENNGKLLIVEGEEEIDKTISALNKEPLEINFTKPLDVYPKREIEESDLIIISPGSFYTSVYPHFISKFVQEKIKDKPKILILNIADTGNLEHKINLLLPKINKNLIAIYNNNYNIPKEIKKKYIEEGKHFLKEQEIKRVLNNYGIPSIGFDLTYERDYGKHDPKKLSYAIKETINYIKKHLI